MLQFLNFAYFLLRIAEGTGKEHRINYRIKWCSKGHLPEHADVGDTTGVLDDVAGSIRGIVVSGNTFEEGLEENDVDL